MTNLLLGKNILVTREATQALPLIHLLEDEGATCYHVPLLCFEAIFDEENRRQLLQLDQQADWLFFTSAKAVLFFDQYVKKLGLTITQKIAAVGEKTSKLLESHHYTIDFQPTVYRGDNMVKEFLYTYGKQRIALIAGEKSRPEIPQLLNAADVSFEKIIIYRTIKNEAEKKSLQRTVTHVDAVFFTSPSTVEAFQQFLTIDQFERVRKELVAVAIGETTATSLEHAQFETIIYPGTYTIENMVITYINYLKKR